jgi:4-amino-4-deoxy-L-arabinose transferase-like glycosyltransferase
MWLAWGLAFMTKGPPGLLPLLAAVAFLAIHDRPRLRSLFPPLGLAAFAIVAFTWFAVIVWQEPDRMRYFLGFEVYDRVFTGVHKRNAEWYGAFEVYLPVLLVGALPWWALALAAAGGPAAAWRRVRDGVRARDRELLLLLYWFFVPLAVFFVAQSRLYLYVVPLFVPLVLMLARPLAAWPWLTDRRLTWIVATTVVVVLALKGVLAYWSHDRDARTMSRAIAAAVDVQDYDEMVFVAMPPFYGLSFYLDVPVEDVLFHRQKGEFSEYVSPETICPEIEEREKALFVVKGKRAEHFRATVRKCGYEAVLAGTFHGDDNELRMYVTRPAGAAPTAEPGP